MPTPPVDSSRLASLGLTCLFDLACSSKQFALTKIDRLFLRELIQDQLLIKTATRLREGRCLTLAEIKCLYPRLLCYRKSIAELGESNPHFCSLNEPILRPLPYRLLGGESTKDWIESYFPQVLEFAEDEDDEGEAYDVIDQLTEDLAEPLTKILSDRFDQILGELSRLGSLPDFRKNLINLLSSNLEFTDSLSDGLTLSELGGLYDAARLLDLPFDFADPNPYRLPFEEAISYFRSRVDLPIDPDQIRAEWRNYAFFVSGVTDAQLLTEIRVETDRAISEGLSLREFEERVEQLASASGWKPKEGVARRARTIFDANLRQAYSYGQMRQYTRPEVLKRYPSWEWRHRDSRNPRPHHLAMNGRRFPSSSSPPLSLPSGFGCRCRWIPRRKEPTEKFSFVNLPDKNGRLRRTPSIKVDSKTIPLRDSDWDSYDPKADPGKIPLTAPGWSPVKNRYRGEVRERLKESLPEDFRRRLVDQTSY